MGARRTTFADRPRVAGDLDICAVIRQVEHGERRRPRWIDDPTSRPRQVQSAEARINDEFGIAIDALYLLVDEISRPDWSIAFREFARPGWAVYAAHWHAGQYAHVQGARPEELNVVAPTREDIEREAIGEIAHLERHVEAGDASDPYEATYAVWNGCRILHTLTTGDPVLSKRSGGAWGLANLPERWHPAIHAAGRNYDGVATPGDCELLRANMAAFVAMVRSVATTPDP